MARSRSEWTHRAAPSGSLDGASRQRHAKAEVTVSHCQAQCERASSSLCRRYREEREASSDLKFAKHSVPSLQAPRPEYRRNSVVQVVEFGIETTCGHQLVVVAGLNHLPRLEHDDAVRSADRGEPVGDDEAGAPLKQPDQRLLDQHLGVAVDVSSGLVEDKDLGVGDEGAGEADQLPLEPPTTMTTAIATPVKLSTIGTIT